MNLKLLSRLSALVLLSAFSSVGRADEVILAPNAKLTLEFPELPETFFSTAMHQSVPARLTAQLPENYSPEGKFPLFVFLGGGNGGRGDSTTARAIVGPRDFITVSMPLFKDPSGAKPPELFPGLNINVSAMVTPNDAPALGKAYRTMLEKLFATVPNVAIERSALGGFSNGAHATGALLAAKDEFILGHFRAFCLFEGGLALVLNPSVLQDPPFHDCRFIALFGDHDHDPKMQLQRQSIAEPLLKKTEEIATAAHLDFTRIVMHGYGHDMPPEYRKLLGQWIRGEKLIEINPP